jgi:hypothetical protein
LSGWSSGPPPCDCQLSKDTRACLELCFQKDPDDRPSALSLLQCDFLVENVELDDSWSIADADFDQAVGHEELSNTKVLSRLETAIDSAVSKSRSAALLSDDTFNIIDRKINMVSKRAQVEEYVANSPLTARIDGTTPTKSAVDNPFGKQKLLEHDTSSRNRMLSNNHFAQDSENDVIGDISLLKKKLSENSTVRSSNSRESSRTNSPKIGRTDMNDWQRIESKIEQSYPEDKQHFDADCKSNDFESFSCDQIEEPTSNFRHESLIAPSKATTSSPNRSEKSSRRVPKLSQIEYVTERTSSTLSVSKSSSARVPAVVGIPIVNDRPFTCQPSLNSATNCIGSSPTLLRRATHQAARISDSDGGVDHTQVWKCLKCSAINTNPKHCEECATVRGINGRRDPKTPLFKRN